MNIDDGFKSVFLERYLANGLGSMSKRDIDTLVMYLLDEYGDATDNKPYHAFSNHEIAERLKINATRVQTLRQEAMLKFMDPQVRVERAKAKLLLVALQGKYHKENDMVEFMVDDAYARSWIQEQFNSRSVVYDSSFNKNIVRVKFEQFQMTFQELFQVKVKPLDAKSEHDDSAVKEWMKTALNAITDSAASALVVEAAKFSLGLL